MGVFKAHLTVTLMYDRKLRIHIDMIRKKPLSTKEANDGTALRGTNKMPAHFQIRGTAEFLYHSSVNLTCYIRLYVDRRGQVMAWLLGSLNVLLLLSIFNIFSSGVVDLCLVVYIELHIAGFAAEVGID